MSLSVGIIGLANVGKSTLFNALLGRQQALTAPYPFATIEPNIGVVDVPDERLEQLHSALSKNSRSGVTSETPIVYSSIRFVDIAGLVKGAAEGHGLGNQFLSHIRDVDVILHVVRNFNDPDIPRAEDSKDPGHDVEIVETELAVKDLEMEERVKNQKKLEPRSGEILSESASRRTTLLSKPTIYVVNVSEKSIAEKGDSLQGVSFSDLSTHPLIHSSGFRGKPILSVCAKIEEEISKLSKNEQKEFLSAYGLERSGLDRIITECFSLLGLISFFTAGNIEVRAWPVRQGSTAPQAAGTIHSDFERLFIRAEIIGWEKLAETGSWQDAKERGWVRTEGKEYVAVDGDVCNFLVGK